MSGVFSASWPLGSGVPAVRPALVGCSPTGQVLCLSAHWPGALSLVPREPRKDRDGHPRRAYRVVFVLACRARTLGFILLLARGDRPIL